MRMAWLTWILLLASFSCTSGGGEDYSTFDQPTVCHGGRVDQPIFLLFCGNLDVRRRVVNHVPAFSYGASLTRVSKAKPAISSTRIASTPRR